MWKVCLIPTFFPKQSRGVFLKIVYGVNAEELSFIWHCPSGYCRMYEKFCGIWTSQIMEIILNFFIVTYCISTQHFLNPPPISWLIRKTLLTSCGGGGEENWLSFLEVYQVLKELLIYSLRVKCYCRGRILIHLIEYVNNFFTRGWLQFLLNLQR